MQRAFVGSGAHRDMYSTRNQVENVNGQVRVFTDLGPGYLGAGEGNRTPVFSLGS
jgi:hypothetical protein